MSVLSTAQTDGQTLRAVLTELYGDGYLTAAHQAAHQAGGTIVASLREVSVTVPDGYWASWTPGWGAAAARAADGGLASLLDQAGVTVRGITGTTLDTLGDTIAAGVSAGDSVDRIARSLAGIVMDPDRAWLIADTELARAMSAASMDTYQSAGVAEWDWLAEADACPECAANADDGPYPVGAGPSVPEHPRCRCAVSPHT